MCRNFHCTSMNILNFKADILLCDTCLNRCLIIVMSILQNRNQRERVDSGLMKRMGSSKKDGIIPLSSKGCPCHISLNIRVKTTQKQVKNCQSKVGLLDLRVLQPLTYHFPQRYLSSSFTKKKKNSLRISTQRVALGLKLCLKSSFLYSRLLTKLNQTR